MNKSGEFLRKRRRELGLKQSDVAKRAGLSVSYISTLERGQKHSITNADLTPARDKVLAIAKALKTDGDEMLVLFGFAPEHPLSPKKPQTLAELLTAFEKLGILTKIYDIEKLRDAPPEEIEKVFDNVSLAIEITLKKYKIDVPDYPNGITSGG
jgi:transcriptional regulator with XRE-family HTH domain